MVLNPELFTALQRRFGQVQVSQPGVCAKIDRQRDYVDPVSGRLRSGARIHRGEQYRCNCPFCDDRGGHLYVHYLYGETLEDGSRRYLAHCFHGCLEHEENRINLWRMLSSCRFRKSKSQPVALSPVDAALAPIPLPEFATPLLDLPREHPAWFYLRSRDFSEEVARDFNLHFCGGNAHYMCRNRLVVPIVMHGMTVGWQARKIFSTQKGAKYFSAPGFQKRLVLYNADIAFQQPYLVVVEGVTDVWRVGSCGVALFGKSMSTDQRELLLATKKPLLLCLDPDAEEATKSLQASLLDAAARVQLPEQYEDPAGTPYAELQAVIEAALEKWSL